jgi:uncharacterized membrane protein YhaH (DUF805 family)
VKLPLYKPFTRTIILVLLVFLIVPVIAMAPANGSAESIASADSAVQMAFRNVLSAQNVGCNVTSLLDRLHIAGELLAEAENKLRSGSSTNVTAKATNALIIANQVNDDAINLFNTQSVNSRNNFWLTISFSVVGACIFVVVLALVWKHFKRRSINKLLEMKPEVIADVS